VKVFGQDFSRTVRFRVATHAILINVLDFWDPEESPKFTNCFPYSKVFWANKIMEMKNIHLTECLELSTNKGVCILHDIVCLNGMDI
jgi:hypothetical protein